MFNAHGRSLESSVSFLQRKAAGWRAAGGVLLMLALPALGQDTVKVTDFGAVPNDDVDDTPAIQQAVASLSDDDTLVFNAPGLYLINGVMGPNPEPVIKLSNLQNLTLSFVGGVSLVIANYDRSNKTEYYPTLIDVENCPGFSFIGDPSSPVVVTTRGATAWTGNFGLPFLQGRVVSVSPATHSARIRVSDPAMFLPPDCQPHLWGAWAYQKASGPTNPSGYSQVIDDMYGGDVQPVGPAEENPPQQLVDLTFNPNAVPNFTNWLVNANVVVELNQSDTTAIWINNSGVGSATVKNVVAYHLPGKFLAAVNLEDLELDNVDVRPANSTRLMSVNRDGIGAGADHLVVQNCDLIGCGDDGMTVQGSSWGEVISYEAPDTFTLAPPTTINTAATWLAPGQNIVLLDKNTLSSSTSEFATIASNTPMTGPNGEQYYKYTFTAPSAGFVTLLGQGAYAYSASNSKLGAYVDNCAIAGNRGLGICVRAIFTRITDCAISDTHEDAIFAGGGIVNAYPWFGAGAPPHGLVVEYCTLTRNGSSTGNATRGAIEVGVARCQGSDPCQTFPEDPIYSAATDVIQNVIVAYNTIREFPRAGLLAANVGGTNGIIAVGNTFEDSLTQQLGSCHLEYGYAIFLQTCAGWTVTPNTYTNCAGTFTTSSSSPQTCTYP